MLLFPTTGPPNWTPQKVLHVAVLRRCSVLQITAKTIFFFFGNPKLQHMTLVPWTDAFEQFYACEEPYC